MPISVTKNTAKNLQKETTETSRVSVIQQMAVDDVITIETVVKNVKDIPTKIITANIHHREMEVDIITSPGDNKKNIKHSSFFSINTKKANENENLI